MECPVSWESKLKFKHSPKNIPDFLDVGMLAIDLLLFGYQFDSVAFGERESIVDEVGDGLAGDVAAMEQLGELRNVGDPELPIGDVLKHAAWKIIVFDLPFSGNRWGYPGEPGSRDTYAIRNKPEMHEAERTLLKNFAEFGNLSEVPLSKGATPDSSHPKDDWAVASCGSTELTLDKIRSPRLVQSLGRSIEVGNRIPLVAGCEGFVDKDLKI